MRFDAVFGWDMIQAKMRFRLLNRLICRAGLAGLFCLAGVWVSRAGNESQESMIYVPANGGTNIERELPADARKFESRMPGMQHHLINAGDLLQGVPELPPPPPLPKKLTQKDQDELDRHDNWVFMTPQEIMLGYEAGRPIGQNKTFQESGSAIEEMGPPTSAIERYYKRLYNPGRFGMIFGITNGPARQASDSESRDSATNYFTVEEPAQRNNGHLFDSPFNNSPTHGIFEAEQPKSFSDIFNVNGDSSTPSAEELRAQKQEAARIESFKQLWDITQPGSLPVSGASSTTAANPIQKAQPIFGAADASASGFSAQSSLSGTQPAAPPSRSGPPHYQFQMPQRRF